METSTQMDRQATWKEVCDALAMSSLNASELPGAQGEDHSLAPNFQPIGLFAEEFAWIELARQAHDTSHN